MSNSCPKKTHDELLESLKSKGLIARGDEVPLLHLLQRKETMENLQSKLIANLKKQLKRYG